MLLNARARRSSSRHRTSARTSTTGDAHQPRRRVLGLHRGRPPHARAQGGSIVNIGSLSSFRGWPGSSVYGMTKAAVVTLTETLAAEWAASGVRVNAIAPGFFMTPLNEKKMSAERKALAIARTPMGRFGELSELVGAAVYLASPRGGLHHRRNDRGRRRVPRERALTRGFDALSTPIRPRGDGVDLATPLTDAAFKEIERRVLRRPGAGTAGSG